MLAAISLSSTILQLHYMFILLYFVFYEKNVVYILDRFNSKVLYVDIATINARARAG